MPHLRLHIPRRAGFTLVELLTVIAVVGILAAIVITTVGRARLSARNAHCMSNLRQIGQLFHLYLADNRGIFPRPIEDGEAWNHRLALYIVNKQVADSVDFDADQSVFSCPSALAPRRRSGSTFLPGYALNQDLTHLNLSSTAVRARLNTIARPADTYLVTDNVTRAFGRDLKATLTQPSATNPDYVVPIERHNPGQTNMLFVDGSVRALIVEDMPWGSTHSRLEAPWGAR